MKNFLKESTKKLNVLKRKKRKSTPDSSPQKKISPVYTCKQCKQSLSLSDLREQLWVCPHCDHYFTVPARERLNMILDPGYEELFTDIKASNPLTFYGYEQKKRETQNDTGLSEAVTIVKGSIQGSPVILGVMDSRFFMGSMGIAVGEKITLAFEEATRLQLPVIMFCASGGARMQEGIFSLMQMAKTSAAVAQHHQAGLLYISCLTHPTTGGVTASFASLGDVILAEPKALIGLAGPRVVAQTINQPLPEGFQSSESLLKHGFIDAIVERGHMRTLLSRLLSLHQPRLRRVQ